MNLQKVANYLIENLTKNGFIIHRYNAFITNSIYLKLDYGACNSIRISDHNGYEHLSYKYNVISGFSNFNGKHWSKDKKIFGDIIVVQIKSH
jgi:hypothetical protein